MTTHEVIEQWKKSRPEDYDQFQDVLGQLKRRKIRGPHHCSRYTLSLLKGMMETCHWEHTHEMMNHFRAGNDSSLACY
jgi:translation initiation factor 2B subunit (eIF-2B alpha/beta/delta family)